MSDEQRECVACGRRFMVGGLVRSRYWELIEKTPRDHCKWCYDVLFAFSSVVPESSTPSSNPTGGPR